ncbi:MAG: sugar kinase [Bdellovibrionales bacterium RIFOXYD12_FULL_39_22]|nr:MAG: sugar kinase [Bdellovibrionales bacterium RIFOXYB1_FULL_39_21]OFZ40729.1 MAG: sugar kinase [Bdellovibrionales bacterium RIFOXYC12_FULL_39_17]OFZ48151.1 MAG: sugar kinase [Bdellovibrionales bacterium RIFOXYC1_FULL_39_130]OFZ75801.1 MAG: sugar kinase [Bdellovibrionales bacterium RIFOXYD1_FULL_39_84]OFZ91862.1 MAG: sugar kinase [Bdellovibrionales bacterium RIFOXYD12_FULL_39_22]HLE11370.1 adenosine kinase [Bacteriovoracaceae bacterium]
MTAKYDVYGLGNALLDIEYEVTDAFLEKMGISKGIMTLVDEKRQDELSANLDNIHAKKGCGGSAANSIIAISQFGGKAFYSCKVANDYFGDFYLSDLQRWGVETNLSESGREAGKTGKCMVMITKDAERTMNTYLGITETFSKKELVDEVIINAKWIYIEGYLVTSETGRAAAGHAHKLAANAGVGVALTLSDPMIVKHFKAGFEEVIQEGVDLLFCNEQEALQFSGASNVLAAGEALKKISKAFAITLGERGAYLFDGIKTHNISTDKVVARDTNGAGDMFAGAFLYALTNGRSFESAAQFACHAASVIVQRSGARLEMFDIKNIKNKLNKI